jgi:hypothetical protein
VTSRNGLDRAAHVAFGVNLDRPGHFCLLVDVRFTPKADLRLGRRVLAWGLPICLKPRPLHTRRSKRQARSSLVATIQLNGRVADRTPEKMPPTVSCFFNHADLLTGAGPAVVDAEGHAPAALLRLRRRTACNAAPSAPARRSCEIEGAS